MGRSGTARAASSFWSVPGRLIVGALGIAFALAVSSSARAEPALRWGADAEGGAPYVFRDTRDPTRTVGFEVEVVQALSRVLGVAIEFRQYDYKSLMLGVERGDLDFAMNGLEATPERRERFRLSRPYYSYSLQLVARASDPRVRSLASCKAVSCTVGTLEETAAERLLVRRGIKTRTYEGQVEPYQDLSLGRIDAVLLDLPIAAYYAADNPKLAFVGEPFARGDYVMLLRKDQDALAQRLDRGLEMLAEAGELGRIFDKWRIAYDDASQAFTVSSSPTPPPSSAASALAQGSGSTVPSSPAQPSGHGHPSLDVVGDSSRGWTLSRTIPLLLQGAWVTVWLSVASMALAIVLGLVLAAARLYAPRPIRVLAWVYVEFFRGIPVLLFLYFLYFGLAPVSESLGLGSALRLTPVSAAILGFGFHYAAYEAEIYRAGLLAVPRGQWDASLALGMSRARGFVHVIAPQALRIVLPPMTNDFIALFKDTSLVSIIAVVELSKQYQILSKSSMKYVELGLLTAGLYLVMSLPLSLLSRRLEQRWARAR